MFLPDLNVGLSNIYQSLKEGGHFAAANGDSLNMIVKEMWSLQKQDSRGANAVPFFD